MEQFATALLGFVSLLARLLLAAVFASAVIGKIRGFAPTVNDMTLEGVPNATFALFGAIGLLILGSLSVALGAWTRFGAIFLLVFLAAATFYYHDFWEMRDPFDPTITDPAVREKLINVFAKKLKLPPDPSQLMIYRAKFADLRSHEVIQFMKNLAIGGGLLSLIAFGGGPWSVDGWIGLKQEEAESAPAAKPRVTAKPQQG
jgi:putative oxidoreductase